MKELRINVKSVVADNAIKPMRHAHCNYPIMTRSFCYGDNLIDALIRLMQPPTTCTGLINVGHPYEFTIHELAQSIMRLTGSMSKIVSMGSLNTTRRGGNPTFLWESPL